MQVLFFFSGKNVSQAEYGQFAQKYVLMESIELL